MATVRVLHLDELIEGAVRVEIDCPGSTTGYTSVPGAALSMSLPQLITMACFTHEEQCGLCDTSDARKQGDQDAEAQVIELRAALQAVELRRHTQERRN
jgi:hypothetical protein